MSIVALLVVKSSPNHKVDRSVLISGYFAVSQTVQSCRTTDTFALLGVPVYLPVDC